MYIYASYINWLRAENSIFGYLLHRRGSNKDELKALIVSRNCFEVTAFLR
jgi:hypothetical protein